MAVGRTVPKGFLPVFSVDTKEEADRLVVVVGSRGMDGKYYSDDLARVRTETGDDPTASLAALDKLSDKLEYVHGIFKKNGHCKCKGKK